jgi:hypothetical protein
MTTMNKQIQQTEIEQIQDETSAPEIQVEAAPDVEGAEQLHGALDEMADSFDVSGFKCAHEDCGLVHTHDSTKHRASDDFDMSESEAASMEANPNCHCGLNELARRGVSGAPSPSRANSMAPIPNEMSRHLDAMF